MARYDDLDTKTIAFITFLSSVLLVVAVVTCQALCYNWLDEVEAARTINESYKASDAAILEQVQMLKEDPHWVEVPASLAPGEPEPKKGDPPKMVKKLQIPLERAQQLLLNELKKQGDKAPQT